MNDENPCAGGAFCLPVDEGSGICVTGCDNSGGCGPGFNCTTPYVLGDFTGWVRP